MAIEKKEIQFVKEIDDVLVMINELVSDIKSGKSLAEITSENLPNLMEAISGANQIPEELKSGVVVHQTIGYRAGELTGILIGK